MSDFKVGDEVQWIDYKNRSEIYDGEVVAIVPPKKKKTDNFWSLTEEQRIEMEVHATVKWLDGTQEDVRMIALSQRDGQLEREFRLKAPGVLSQIDQMLDVASKALEAAEKIAEEHGVPFYANVSPLSQSYQPNSFETKWVGIDKDIVAEITDASNDYSGWRHSAVCY